MSLTMRKAALLIGLVLLATPAAAELRSTTFVSGLSSPLAFVQDPSDPTVQYIVEQGGRIRVVRGGTLLSTDFLDVSASIVSGGEQGLLGLAFPPDYATSGRFYVNFTNTAGDTVVARFKRASTSPPRGDPASRLDLLWSTGERVIRQPFANHNGGNLAFGPDGYLYIGMGDGGSGDDPLNNAQTPSSLLGKMLRIDVSVPDNNTTGFRVPADNPFINDLGTRPEIWSFGLRNPFRWSFDDLTKGGTGALVIGDVGQNRFEEIDYEPRGRGGRNYGWRIREGAHDEVTTLPPAFLPLTEPIFEYSHADGISVIGGFVYRGSALPAANRGRYFYADLVGRVWSLALTINPSTLEATASDLREHTAELGGQATLGNISSMGVDANGELYICSYSRGVILKVGVNAAPAPAMSVDAPATGSHVRQPFVIGGWALDLTAGSGTGIDTIHVWAYPTSGAAPIFVGSAPYGGARPDLAAIVGPQFTPSGFGMLARGIPPGRYLLVVFARVVATGAFGIARALDITIDSGAQMAIDAPARNSTVTQPFVVGGWAIDGSAAAGSGVDTIHVWAYPTTGAAPFFLGVPALGGSRPDVGGIFGSQFTPSGYNLLVSHLPAGTWDIVVFLHSSVSGVFETAQVVRVTSTGF
jgi:glucose/arabinose dehydrogenase